MKNNMKILMTMLVVGIIVWVALFIAIYWGGYQTLRLQLDLLALTFVNYIIIDAIGGLEHGFEVIFSEEESN